MATLNEYEIGDVAVVHGTFNRNTGTAANPVWVLTDPTTVECEVRKPSGLVTTYIVATGQIVKDSTGKYHLEIGVSEEGDWWYEFEGTGAATGTRTGGFRGVEQRVDEPILNANALVSMGRARDYLLGTPNEASKDERVAFLVNWASEAIMLEVEREFVKSADDVTRTFDYSGIGYLSLSPYEIRSVDEIKLYTDADELTLTSDDYRLEPRGKSRQNTYLSIDLPVGDPLETSGNFEFQVEVTGDWGMASIPQAAQGACLLMIKDLWMNPGGFQSYNVGPTQLSESHELPGVVSIGGVPPGARRALRPFYRRREEKGRVRLSRPLRPLWRTFA